MAKQKKDLTNNYWPTDKDRALIRVCQNLGLYVLPQKNMDGDLDYIIQFRKEVVNHTDSRFTDKNSSHAIILLYRKYYKRLYETKSIIYKGPVKAVVPKVEEKKVDKPKENKLF